MKKLGLMVLMLVIGVIVGVRISGKLSPVEGQSKAGTGFAAVPGAVGGEDLTGAYDVVKNWPKDISTLPGNEKWTYGAGQGIFAESPNRVYMLFRGELPSIKAPKPVMLPQLGPSLSFPIGRLPWRDATVAAMPGAGGTGQDPDDEQRRGCAKAEQEHCRGHPRKVFRLARKQRGGAQRRSHARAPCHPEQHADAELAPDPGGRQTGKPFIGPMAHGSGGQREA